MKVVICGGRAYEFTREDIQWLDTMDALYNFTMVIEGGQRRKNAEGKFLHSADYDAYCWAKSRDIETHTESANWSMYGRAAGPIRNEIMAGMGDMCIAFPGGRGTADMVKQAKARGLRVIERWTCTPTT